MLHVPYGPYERFLKRPLDCILSLCACIVLSPAMALIAFLIYHQLGRPILYSQERIGRGEKPFRLYKFRSMTNERDADGKLLPDEVRLTPFGAKLRSSSLDELPELFNIVKGEMALVGPRPMPTQYLPYYKKEERIIHSVRGGLVPPDVLTRHPVYDWDEQFENEARYVKKISLMGDVKIILSTFAVLRKRSKTQYGTQMRRPLSEARSDMNKEMKRQEE